jgi:hypothetical protein
MKPILSAILGLTFFAVINAQKVPEGYILQYQQNFSNSKSLLDFRFSNPDIWGIFNRKDNLYLQSNGNTKDTNKAGPAGNIAVLNKMIFGDFILEADVMPSADSGGFMEVCFVLALRDQNHYYYIQVANRSDSNNHGIFVVKNSNAGKLTPDHQQPVNWVENKWYKIRIERNIVERTIEVFVNNLTKPVLQTKDFEFVMGYIGFGSCSNICRFDNIKIWAPTALLQDTKIFSTSK